MTEELAAMAANHTWSIVPLPPGKKAIGCRWLYKNKYNSDGVLARRKARLVAKGYNQRESLDYLDTFSLVAKLVTIKLLLALASSQHWHLSQLDINNAYLNGDLYEAVYMDIPMGCAKQVDSSNSKMVCKLHKFIYGLKAMEH